MLNWDWFENNVNLLQQEEHAYMDMLYKYS